jgi:hypothetical protein
MSALSRRAFLALSGAAAATTGIEGIVAARRAPAYAQGTRLHLLQWSHFIPAVDTLFEAQAKEFGKQAGAEIAIERINQNDLQARATAAIQSGAGADIMILANNHAHLYESSLVDVSDVAEEIGGKQGGWYDYAKVNCVAGSRWIGVPHFIISWAITRSPAVEEGPQDRGVSRDAGLGAPGRPRRAARTQGHRGAVEVHHRRHVRQGDPGHEARGRGRVGGRRAEEDL